MGPSNDFRRGLYLSLSVGMLFNAVTFGILACVMPDARTAVMLSTTAFLWGFIALWKWFRLVKGG